MNQSMTIVFLQDGQVALLKVHQVLQKKEEGSKSINETLLSRLRPYRSSSTAASLVALSGTETTPARKDDNNGEKIFNLKHLVNHCLAALIVNVLILFRKSLLITHSGLYFSSKKSLPMYDRIENNFGI